jgi:hypothetical protein
VKNILERFNSRFQQEEEKTSKLMTGSIEITQSEKQKREQGKMSRAEICETPSSITTLT